MRSLAYKFILLCCAILFSCEDETLDADYSLARYLKRAGFSESVAFVNGGDYEMGLRFKPKVDGKLRAFIIRIPEYRSDLRVTLWDAESKVILVTKIIPAVSANVEMSYAVNPFPLKEGDEYMITCNSNDWYNRSRPDNSNVTYPITFENIEITGYGYVTGTAQVYPTSFPVNYCAGDLSFTFN